MMERTLVLLKPDAVERMLTARILARFEDAGLKIVGMKMVWVTPEFSKKHYKAHVSKDFYAGLEQYITEGPVVAAVLEGVDVVSTVRKMIGATEPKQAAPGTIRGDFAHHSYEWSDAKSKSIKNLIHASGTKKEADEEIENWFSDEELHGYQTVHEKHVF